MILLTAVLLLAHVVGISQTITISAQRMPFKQLFTELEKQSGYVVFYNIDMLKKTKPVTVSVKDMPLESFLHTVMAASGGDKATQYYFSANFNNNQDIILNSGLKRYQTRLNLDRTINDNVKAGIRINYSIIDRAVNSADIGTNTLWYRSTIFLAPTIKAYKEDGKLNDFNTQWYSGTLFDSPLANATLRTNDQKEKNLNAMAYIEVKPYKNILAKSTISWSDYNSNWNQYTPGTMPTRTNAQTGGYAYKRSYNVTNLLNENTLSYKKSWNKTHNFDALYGFTIQIRKFSNMNVSGTGYFVDDNEMNDLGAVPSKETIGLGSYLEDQARVSHLGRLNYNYKSKYYITVTGRADGASNFASNNKWGIFPSAAVKWNVSREPFMKNVRAIDELAVRLSGGTSGNDAIARYQSLSRLTATTGGYIFNGAQPVAYYPSRIANEGLSWERTTSFNAGLDLSLLNKRLDITLDVYKSLTTDLLLTVQLPTQVGYDSRLANIGKTSNKGIEIAINYDVIKQRNFTWTTTITAAHNRFVAATPPAVMPPGLLWKHNLLFQ